MALKERETAASQSSQMANSQSRVPVWLRSKSFYVLLILSIIGISFWNGAGRDYLNLQNPRVDIANLQKVDVDYHMLYPSLEAKQNFAQTFRWWREPWRADQWVGAYWRPLSMQAWWIESHVFGEDHSFNWTRVSVFLCAIFDLLLVAFIWALTKNRWLALAALAIFALPPGWLHAVCPLSDLPTIANADLLIAKGWKDQPDLWANCLSLGALIFVLRERWGWALLCTGLAIGFKESGLMVVPMVAILAASNGSVKRIPLWVYGAAVGMLALMMFGRWLAGPLVFHFHSYGRDVGGPTRYANAVLPLAFTAFSTYGYALFGIGLFALILKRPKSLIVWLVSVLLLLAISIRLLAIQTQQTMDVAFAQFLLLGWAPILMLLVWQLLFAVLWTQKKYFWPAMILAACAYVAALPFAMATQAAVHCLAMGRALQAGFGACWIFGLAAAGYQRLKESRPDLVARFQLAEGSNSAPA